MTKMRLSVVFLCVFLASASFAADNVKNFDGYQVFRVATKNIEEGKIVQNLEEEFDFWHDSGPNGADIMSGPEKIEYLTNFFNEHNFNYSLLVQDVGKLIQNEKIENIQNSNGRMNWSAYQRFATIESWIGELGAQYADIVTLYSAGQSHEGRELYIIKISKNNGLAKKAFWIDGGIHAREWITPAFVTYMTNELLSKQDQYANILDQIEFFIMPVHNPDGYEFTHTSNRMWRKTRMDHSPGGNCPGTDGNRNYGYEWGGVGASTNPCAETYRGPAAWSEPEAVAVENAIRYFASEGVNWDAFLTIHSYGQYLLYPWAYTDELAETDAELRLVGNLARDAIRSLHGTIYTVGPSFSTIYPHSGTSQDWAYGEKLFRLSYTYELRDTGASGFILPPAQIIPCSEETWLGVLAMIQYAIDN